MPDRASKATERAVAALLHADPTDPTDRPDREELPMPTTRPFVRPTPPTTGVDLAALADAVALLNELWAEHPSVPTVRPDPDDPPAPRRARVVRFRPRHEGA